MKVIVVVKRSTWEQYHQNPGLFGKLNRESLRRAKTSHDRQEKSSAFVFDAFHKLGVKPWVVNGPETAFDSSNASLVVCVGGDGTLLSASHHVGKETPLLGINNDPTSSRGHFCAGAGPAAHRLLDEFLAQRSQAKKITRMTIKVGGKVVSRRILNEALFSHTCPAAMTRLTLYGDKFACSGVWVGTGAGSTGAIASAGGKVLPPTSRSLQAVIREHCGAQAGRTSPWFLDRSFTLVSKTADATLYLDGPFLRVPVGYDQKVDFQVSDDPLSLVV